MVRTAVCILPALLGVALTAQELKPRFEVASVKVQPAALPADPEQAIRAYPRALPGGVFNPTHATVESLVLFAYDLKRAQVVNGPDWIRQVPFQIEARAGRDATASELKLMVQSLLEDRFKLVARAEERSLPFIALVRAKAEGPLGPYLRQVVDCNRDNAAVVRQQFPPRAITGGAGLSGGCSEMAVLADMLALFTQQHVIDRTGLTGRFVYDLRAASLTFTQSSRSANDDPALPPLPIALEEQLGLKIEQTRGPVGVLVIDSVEEPTEN